MEQIETYLSEALKSNFITGSLALGALGIMAAYLRIVGARIHGFVMRRLRISVTLDNRWNSYRHFHIWMEAEGTLSRARVVRMTDCIRSHWTRAYGPAPGRHWFTHVGNICRLDRSLNERAKVGGSYDQRLLETIGITGFLGRAIDTILVDDDRIDRLLPDMRWFYGAQD